MKGTLRSLLLLLGVGSASAHTIFQKVYVNGVDQGELTGIRAPSYDGVRACLPALSTLCSVCSDRISHCVQPITDVTSNDLICNGGQFCTSMRRATVLS